MRAHLHDPKLAGLLLALAGGTVAIPAQSPLPPGMLTNRSAGLPARLDRAQSLPPSPLSADTADLKITHHASRVTLVLRLPFQLVIGRRPAG